MKTAILVWVVGFSPLTIEFDTHSACHEFELSLKRQVATHFKLKPRQTYTPGYARYQGRSTPYFKPCFELLHIEKYLKNSEST